MSAKNLRRVFSMVAVLAAIVFGVVELVQDGNDSASQTSASATTSTRDGTSTPDEPTRSASPTRASTLPTVSIGDLPDEAIATLALVEDGGPYPYPQDDGTFQNREGILPARERGYYREFTVETPGSPDRGARRIVVGADGDRYYTDDHYDSFREIVAR